MLVHALRDSLQASVNGAPNGSPFPNFPSGFISPQLQIFQIAPFQPAKQLTSHSITKIRTCSAARAILQRVSIPQLQTGFIDSNVERENVTNVRPWHA